MELNYDGKLMEPDTSRNLLLPSLGFQIKIIPDARSAEGSFHSTMHKEGPQ
jgi:hypothetical protein